jgi:hypothetical protein
MQNCCRSHATESVEPDLHSIDSFPSERDDESGRRASVTRDHVETRRPNNQAPPPSYEHEPPPPNYEAPPPSYEGLSPRYEAVHNNEVPPPSYDTVLPIIEALYDGTRPSGSSATPPCQRPGDRRGPSSRTPPRGDDTSRDLHFTSGEAHRSPPPSYNDHVLYVQSPLGRQTTV